MRCSRRRGSPSLFQALLSGAADRVSLGCERETVMSNLAELCTEARTALVVMQPVVDSLSTFDELGLTPYLKRSEAWAKHICMDIQALGKHLKWDRRTVDAGRLPSISFLAKRVGEAKLYQFLYHASSRYVHYSPAELLRRAWGRTGSMSISSHHFADYWGFVCCLLGRAPFYKNVCRTSRAIRR
jgi:hypothetical protein